MCCKGRVSSFDEYEIGDRFQTVVISWMTVSDTELLKALVAAERDERVLFALGGRAAVLLRFLLRYHMRCAVTLYVPLDLCVIIYTSGSLCDVLHAEGALWQTTIFVDQMLTVVLGGLVVINTKLFSTMLAFERQEVELFARFLFAMLPDR